LDPTYRGVGTDRIVAPAPTPSSTITDVACYQDPEGAADGKGILFSSVPVTVDYPDITVEAQSGSFRFRFAGRMTSDGTIQGQSGGAPGTRYPMSLARGGSYCGL
jgi:hypothetical protein